MVVGKFISQNPFEQLQAKYKQLENGLKVWLAKQSLPVEAAVVTAASAIQGAAIGGFMGTLTKDVSSTLPTPPQGSLNPQAMASLQQAQALSGGPLVQARNFAVMTGVNAGISCVMKRLRGKEDVQSSHVLNFNEILAEIQKFYDVIHSLRANMVAAFGSGAMFSLVSGLGGPNQAGNAVTSGLFFALIQGGLFQISQKYSQPRPEDPALKDVRIPPGPRLLILDHIQRDPELKEIRARRG
ncbi:Mitochondrial inner membrane translocase subunit Tim17/Tim22/Tim23/peroxisomal protein PMP24 [Corchorus olitorius]|uniref:Mitochondrial inner membrane translocase subunit Tim17/Tim22/Tim23/peroxisomal protein PMP24 n=1 Tax=Corchorus olitorius TaxID=93759 RepID=A0A1R3JS56_9ROSI|nr:Mitochondrial inner membrane translocase subunit Tim17/Tim22/Tim23/peroxisomal protein PMP24 [Corchorus olitorius]